MRINAATFATFKCILTPKSNDQFGLPKYNFTRPIHKKILISVNVSVLLQKKVLSRIQILTILAALFWRHYSGGTLLAAPKLPAQGGSDDKKIKRVNLLFG